jgi:hypothetical protein
MENLTGAKRPYECCNDGVCSNRAITKCDQCDMYKCIKHFHQLNHLSVKFVCKECHQLRQHIIKQRVIDALKDDDEYSVKCCGYQCGKLPVVETAGTYDIRYRSYKCSVCIDKENKSYNDGSPPGR